MFDVLTPTCSCNKGAPAQYLNVPYSCSNDHHENKLVNMAGHTAELAAQSGCQPHEALTLARHFIAFFSRPDTDMSPGQRTVSESLRTFIVRENLEYKLGLLNAEKHVSRANLETLTSLINTVFFFGAIKNPAIR